MVDEPRGPGRLAMPEPSGPTRFLSPVLKQQTLFYAGPPLLLMAFIFWLGTDRASSAQTRSLLETLLQHLWPDLYSRLSPDTLATLNFIVRKGGHFTGYALLALLDARALRGLRGRLDKRDLVAAWSAAVAWAAVDEIHQSFSPTRGGIPDDVALDAAGAAAGVLFYFLWKRRTITRS